MYTSIGIHLSEKDPIHVRALNVPKIQPIIPLILTSKTTEVTLYLHDLAALEKLHVDLGRVLAERKPSVFVDTPPARHVSEEVPV